MIEPHGSAEPVVGATAGAGEAGGSSHAAVPGGNGHPPGAGLPLVRIEKLVKYYPITGGVLRRHIGDVRAVDGVSLDVNRGEVMGLVGESGCGKSTFGKTLVRLLPATSGEATLDGEDIFAKHGRDLKRLRRRMQIIFQDPVGSLNPRMPISDIIGEGLLAQADQENGWKNRKVRDDRVGQLPRDRRAPPRLRPPLSARVLGRAAAAHRNRTSAGAGAGLRGLRRAGFRARRLDPVADPQSPARPPARVRPHVPLHRAQSLGRAVHQRPRGGDVPGQDRRAGARFQLYADPRHPYTVALLSAVPVPDPRQRTRRLVLKGDVPSPANPPSGCRFHTRCWLREQLGNPEVCSTDIPLLRDLGGGQMAACHFAEKINPDTVRSAAGEQPRVVAAEADAE